MKPNMNFAELSESYLFSTVAKKQREFEAAHPAADVIRLSIGDVTKPLAPAVIEAMHKAVDEMANEKTFRGYPPEYGYDFLIDAIRENDYTARGIDISADEIFVSDGAKSDCGNIGDIIDSGNKIAICDPVYPVYIDSNVMSGRHGIILMPCKAENNFLPELPSEIPDVIYLCFPNNPTGVAANREELKKWVDFALENNSLILFDSAYEAYVTGDGIPKSIYEIDGAKKCAIELRSFSKTAGFTGVRCGYTVVPKELVFDGVSLNKLWARRQATKFNGVSYITQRAAEAVYSPEGKRQTDEIIEAYRKNAKTIFDGLTDAGFECYGGVNSPYIWLKVPEGRTSWEFFDELLEKCQVVSTPGSGFGEKGEGYLRLTAFNTAEKTAEAVGRIKSVYKK